MKAEISLCIIVKNEPILEQCLQSVRDHVKEIVIVDTGSTDDTPEVARKYADIFKVYTDCNDPTTGLINDFSKARNYSFSLATQTKTMWCDADDVVEGMSNLSLLLQRLDTTYPTDNSRCYSVLFPYEYSYDANGKCTCRHYRERIFSNKDHFTWKNPVHEVAVINDGIRVQLISDDTLLYKHRRQYGIKPGDPGRNLRILKKYVEGAGKDDARQMYYIGLEYYNNGFVSEAIDSLTRYVSISGWDDERVMACLKLVDIYQGLAKYQDGLTWAFKAIEISENWAEGYLAAGKMFYFLAQAGGAHQYRNWQRCAHFIKIGLSMPPTKTLLFINPLERDFEIHKYLNVALNSTGDVKGALESVNTGLQVQSDAMLLGNKKLYEKFFATQQISQSLETLKNIDHLDNEAVNLILSIVNDKSHIKHLLNPPTNGKIVSKDKYDIIFYIGQGMEDWTPETVKRTGIGGSELMAIELSKRLAQQGNRVRIYNSCGKYGEGTYDGVEYYQSEKFQNLECDVLIVSRLASMIDDKYHISAKLKLLWVHDIYALGCADAGVMYKYDRILALSEWHKKNISNFHKISEDCILTTRNGIDLSRFNKQIERNRFKIVNSSSPDRYLPILLDCWPDIKVQVPQATLHIFYGFKNWELAAQHDPNQLSLISRLKAQMEAMKSVGVMFRDRVNQEQLAEEFLSAGVWAYSTWFGETSCQLSGSLIFTNQGMKPIENIKVGDLVLTHKGRFRPVIKLIQKEYSGKLYSIKKRKDFNPITLTEEHPLLTATFHKRADSRGGRIYFNNNLNVNWQTPENLVVKRNYLISPRMKFGNLTNIKFSDYIDLPVDNHGMIGPKKKLRNNYKYIENNIEITSEFMYILGLFAAEGCATAKRGKQKPQYRTITFAMHLREIEKAKRTIRFFGGGKITQTSENGIIATIHHSVWAKFLASQIGTGRNKHIPSFVWECSNEHQYAFIMGMFEGDGCVRVSNNHNNARKNYKFSNYTSISPSLAYGLSQLLSNQGIYSTISYSLKRKAYTLDWSDNYKCPQHRILDEGFATKIISINSEYYEGTVYNFEVEEDRSYVTDRTIVHNCISAMEAQAAGLRMITSPIAALNETVADRGVLIPGDWTSPEYKKKFVESVVAALQKEDDSDRLILQRYARDHFDLDVLARDWEQMFGLLMKKTESIGNSPIIAYDAFIGK